MRLPLSCYNFCGYLRLLIAIEFAIHVLMSFVYVVTLAGPLAGIIIGVLVLVLVAIALVVFYICKKEKDENTKVAPMVTAPRLV